MFGLVLVAGTVISSERLSAHTSFRPSAPFSPAITMGAQVHQDKANADTPEFLASEAEVRRSFLDRYPPSGRAAQLANLPTTTPEQRFDISVALAMVSRMVPTNQKPPSHFRAQLASLVGTQDLGTGLGRIISGKADESQPDPKSVDKLAKQNMRIFKAMAVQYGGITSETFDSSSPLLQAQYILGGAKGAARDILFPCPYTIYLLDEDKQLRDAGDEPHFARDFYEHLAGRNNDYLQFNSYNRQQRTEALERGFIVMIDRGHDQALHYDPSSLANFASMFGMSVVTSGSLTLTFTGPNGRRIIDDTLVASIFGLDGQNAFRQMAEGPMKNNMRAAAFLLMCEGDAVLAPMMLG